MPDFYGPIQSDTIAGALWLIPFVPLLAALFCAAHALTPRPLGASGRRAVASLSVAAVALSFGASAYHAWVLASKAQGDRVLLQHLWRLVQIGQLDASFDLTFDPLTATMALVVTGIGLPIFVFAAASMADDPAYARFFAWLNGFVAAMLLLVLADNFILLFFGWEAVGLCSWALIGFWWQTGAKASAGRKAFVVNRVGDVGLVIGIALLYWGLGGSWTESDYVPDLNARFAAVQVGAPPREGREVESAAPGQPPAAPADDEERATPAEADDQADQAEETPEERAASVPPMTGEGFLTLTSYSGADIFMDDARTPLTRAGAPLRAPFSRFPVKAGIHSFRIHPGGPLDDFLVTHVTFGGGREIALTSVGPTVTFRNLRDQLAARDAHNRAPLRDAFVAKRAYGNIGVLTLACLLLFAGAAGKSAQFPLYVWLPDAMAGPTPVSALIHAATMVTAGVYLVARVAFLFVLSPPACTVIAVVGAGTALFAATMGLYQYDLKRILAYSTISQLGFMMLGVGVGAYEAGIFHLVTHACFKACLFLAAGAAIHALHELEKDERRVQDVRRLGGLRRALPKTAGAYFIGCLAISAAPVPGLAGFWSKDEIIARAFRAENLVRVPGPALSAIALMAAGLTSFYMWRSWYLVFEGEPRGAVVALVERAREPTPAITGALMTLAALSAVAGVVGLNGRLVGRTGTAGESLLSLWLDPVFCDAHAPFAHGSVAGEWEAIGAAYAVAFFGWALARAHYRTRASSGGAGDPAQVARDHVAREHRALLFAPSTHGWWLDAIYNRTVVAFTRRAAVFVDEFDRRVIDGLVNAVGALVRSVAWVVGRADDGLVDGAVRLVSQGALRVGARLQRLQTGRIQTYAFAIVIGVITLAFLPYWLR